MNPDTQLDEDFKFVLADLEMLKAEMRTEWWKGKSIRMDIVHDSVIFTVGAASLPVPQYRFRRVVPAEEGGGE